ncbi:unnamed protein product [Closterium sp. Yama58-4]|nr:unnamed protein product [Closterium sp. Yama58-4]
MRVWAGKTFSWAANFRQAEFLPLKTGKIATESAFCLRHFPFLLLLFFLHPSHPTIPSPPPASLSSPTPFTSLRTTAPHTTPHPAPQLLACALNAAFAALLDAGLPLACLPAAVQLALDSQGQLLLDPTKQEQQTASATVCTVFANRPLAPDGTSPHYTRCHRTSLHVTPHHLPLLHSVHSIALHRPPFISTAHHRSQPALKYVEALERAELACRVIDAFSRTGLEQYQKRREVVTG